MIYVHVHTCIYIHTHTSWMYTPFIIRCSDENDASISPEHAEGEGEEREIYVRV